MIGHDPSQGTAENYRGFALEAAGRSPLYEEWSNGVAADPDVLAFLGGLPWEKRQPNLLFAAVRHLAGLPPDYAAFRDTVLGRREEMAAVMRARRTQTNEPARCATWLPLLAGLPQPLALLEVGASAGLCLLPDRYGYAYADDRTYGEHRIDGDPGAPVFTCGTEGPVPLPDRPVEVVWRAGIDLNPLDVTDPDDLDWLACLVWPGEGDRARLLAEAAAVARRDPPRIVRGDLVDRLAGTVAAAPSGATLVVFHSAVLVYLTPERRAAFAEAVRALDAVWLASESPRVLAGIPGFPADLPHPAIIPSAFLVARDGRDPVASVDGHGAWIRWLP